MPAPVLAGRHAPRSRPRRCLARLRTPSRTACGTRRASRIPSKNRENPWSGRHGGRTLWPSARLRPHNDGMTGSLVAARHARRRAAVRDAGGTPPGRRPGGTGRSADRCGIRSSGAAPLLTVSGLSLSYGRLRALSDINLTVRSGELVALAGENGAGKTTLVRCIAGDVVPASGEIYLGGKRVPPDPGGAARQGRRRGLAGPGAVRQPGHRGEHHARPGVEAADAVRDPLPRGRRVAAGRAAHPAEGHHPQRALAVRRPAPAGGGGPGHGPPAAAAGPGRADRQPGRQGIGPGRRADHEPARAGHHDPARLPRHRPDVPARRPHRGAAPGPDRRRPAPGRHAPGRRGRAALRPDDRLLRPPPAHPAARADRPAGVSADPWLEPVADPVRARRGAQHRAAVHSPGQRPDPVLRRVARLHARRAGTVGPAAVRSRRRPGGPGRGRRAPGDRRQRAGRRGLAELPRPGQDGQRGQLVVGPGARAGRAQRRDHGLPHRSTARPSGTSSTWSPSTRATPPARSNGTGCWTR